MPGIHWIRRQTLSTQLALSATLAALLLTLLLTSLSLMVMRGDLTRSVSETQNALVEGVAQDLDEKLELRRHALDLQSRVLGERVRLDDAAGLHDFFISRPLLNSLFDFILVADAQGRLVYDIPDLAGRRGRSIADRAYFKELMKTGQAVISTPLPGRATGQPSINFAVPIAGPQGRPIGALIGSLYLNRSNFLTDLGARQVGKSGYFALMTKGEQPVMVMHPQSSRIMESVNMASIPGLERALKGFVGTVEDINPQGVHGLFSFKSMKSAPWVMAAVYPTAEAYAKLRARERAVASVGCGVAVLWGALTWLLVGWLLRPLERLRHAMENQHADPESPAELIHANSRDVAALARAYSELMTERQRAQEALRMSERRLRSIADNMPAMVGYVDRDQLFRFVNRHYAVIYGLEIEDILGRSVQEVLGPATFEQVRPHVDLVLQGAAQHFERERAGRKGDLHLMVDYIPDIEADGSVVGFYAMTVDITQRKAAELKLLQSEGLLRAVTDNLPVLISYVDADHILRFANGTFRRWLNIEPSAAIGQSLRDVLGPELYAPRAEYLARALQGERAEFEAAERLHGAEFFLQNIYIPDLQPDGSVAGVFMLSSDITEMMAVQHQLDDLARVDSLTGLPNRRQFEEKLAEALLRARRLGRPMALIFLDVDHFKSINDSMGHAAGDAVLKAFGERLRLNMRATDLAARLAGDEFVVLLEGVDSAKEAGFVAQKILDALRKEITIGDTPRKVTASMGVAFVVDAQLTAEDVLQCADEALYLAKRAGRDGYCVVPCYKNITGA